MSITVCRHPKLRTRLRLRLSTTRLKLDPKARAGLFSGYEGLSKAYRVYDIEAEQVVISRDVNFDEYSHR